MNLKFDTNWNDFCEDNGLFHVANNIPLVESGALRALVARPRFNWYRFGASLRIKEREIHQFKVDYFPSLDSWVIFQDGKLHDINLPFLTYQTQKIPPLRKLDTRSPLTFFKFQGSLIWGSLRTAADEHFQPIKISSAGRRYVHVVGGNVQPPATVNDGFYTEMIIDSLEGYAVFLATYRAEKEHIRWNLERIEPVRDENFSEFIQQFNLG